MVPAFFADSSEACPFDSPGDFRYAVVFAGAHEDVDVVRPKGQGVNGQVQFAGCFLEALNACLLHNRVLEDGAAVLERELQLQVQVKVCLADAEAVVASY